MNLFGYNLTINAISVTLVLICVLALLAMHKVKGKKTSIEDFFVSGFAAASIPTGCTLIYCAYDPSKISLLSDVTMQIALVGAGVIFISYKTIRERI
ncbi:hypothetical protein [Sedimenticola selenatireducens]|uniref:hypothetical protein n=1 Tax=Sedimenticola selenatireducens TaxID=191960 RepID=UPI002AAB1AB7|nr:hypothetical protein [Sedimenticola selenatireducens]